MADYVVTKDCTASKIKTEVKDDIVNKVFQLLSDEGYEVGMVRSSGESPKNEIGVVVGTVENEGIDVPVCVTINISAKDFVERKTAKKVYPVYDFKENNQRYFDWLEEKSNKDAEKARMKEEKIAKDKAKREKNED
jgi:glycine cleavage system aminomethyltransferase T